MLSNRIRSKFLLKKPDGATVNIELTDLSLYCFDDFMDFFMEYFVTKEITHQVSGIPRSSKAMAECKHFYSHILRNNPKTFTILCCEENAKPKIVGFSALKIVNEDEPDYDTTQLKTKEMKKFFEVLRSWNNLFPVPDLMRKYNIDSYLDSIALAVHPDYIGCGIARTLGLTRRKICKLLDVPLTGAWMTAPGSAKAAENVGFVTLFQISHAELSKNLHVSFENPTSVSKYMVAKPWGEN